MKQNVTEIDSQDYRDYVIKDGRFIGEFEQMYRNIDDPWGTVENVGSLKNNLLLALIAHINSVHQIDRALHAGCALGALTARLKKTLGESSQVWGCDISETAINKATASYPGIDFLVHDLADIQSVSFPKGSLDLIVMAETMWYVLPWLAEIMAYFHALLQPGGHLVLQQYFLPPGQQTYGNEIVSTPEDLLKSVVESGFSIRHQMNLDPGQNHCFMLWASARE